MRIQQHLALFDRDWMSDTDEGYRVYQRLSKLCGQDWFRPETRSLTELKGSSTVVPTICQWILSAVDYAFESLDMTLTRARELELKIVDRQYQVIEKLIQHEEEKIDEEEREHNSNALEEEDREGDPSGWQIDLVLELIANRKQKQVLELELEEVKRVELEIQERLDFTHWEMQAVNELREEDVTLDQIKRILTHVHDHWMSPIQAQPHALRR